MQSGLQEAIMPAGLNLNDLFPSLNHIMVCFYVQITFRDSAVPLAVEMQIRPLLCHCGANLQPINEANRVEAVGRWLQQTPDLKLIIFSQLMPPSPVYSVML